MGYEAKAEEGNELGRLLLRISVLNAEIDELRLQHQSLQECKVVKLNSSHKLSGIEQMLSGLNTDLEKHYALKHDFNLLCEDFKQISRLMGHPDRTGLHKCYKIGGS